MLDANLLFSNAQDVSADGYGTTTLTVGPGIYDVEVAILGTVTGTSPTCTVTVRESDASDFSSGVRNIGDTRQFTATQQTDRIRVHCKATYLRVYYDVGGTTPVFNDITAGIVSGLQRHDQI